MFASKDFLLGIVSGLLAWLITVSIRIALGG
jgi:hypothetical protein